MPQVFERRSFPRLRITRSCKVFHPGTQKFLPARTTDVSAYGALLRIDSPRALQPGEELDIAVAWDGEPILPQECLMRATVVRTGPGTLADAERCQTVAVRFRTPVREAAHLAAVA
ncbi:MAG: PilZ domain-containing protein [Phycisphaerales bacterium]|nr:PilZ domain-containing protein [Phycisphaerales bacterium]